MRILFLFSGERPENKNRQPLRGTVITRSRTGYHLHKKCGTGFAGREDFQRFHQSRIGRRRRVNYAVNGLACSSSSGLHYCTSRMS